MLSSAIVWHNELACSQQQVIVDKTPLPIHWCQRNSAITSV